MYCSLYFCNQICRSTIRKNCRCQLFQQLTDKNSLQQESILTFFATQKCSIQVSIYDSLPTLRGHAWNRWHELASSIIHKKVYFSIRGNGFFHQVCYLKCKAVLLMQCVTQWLIIYRFDISIYLDFVPPQRYKTDNVSVAISMYL